MKRWAETIKAQDDAWSEAFVYFKHEESGIGPKLAMELGALLGKTRTRSYLSYRTHEGERSFLTNAPQFYPRYAAARRFCLTKVEVERASLLELHSFRLERLIPVQALLQDLHQVDHVRRARSRHWFTGDFLVLRFLLDHFHDRGPIFIAIFLRLPWTDMLSTRDCAIFNSFSVILVTVPFLILRD